MPWEALGNRNGWDCNFWWSQVKDPLVILLPSVGKAAAFLRVQCTACYLDKLVPPHQLCLSLL